MFVCNEPALPVLGWLAPVISFTAEEAWKEYCALGILEMLVATLLPLMEANTVV